MADNVLAMIAYLSGTLLEKEAASVIIDAGGIGYEVSIPLSTFYELDDEGSPIALRIYTQVREDAIQLYGFKTLRERELFLRLISVSGVGPKMGLALLSGLSADELVSAIRADNLARLTGVPGVGRKTAERLVLELRDKINDLAATPGASVAAPLAAPAPPEDAVRDDALSALINLGYQRPAAEKAIKTALHEGGANTVQALIRRSLQLLAKG
jgi:Holliday junction DNA helicase RuvA